MYNRFLGCVLLAFASGTTVFAQSLDAFQRPPQETMPRVWWHWMNGNITKDGIVKDIQWMK
ncbi:MAG: hypothetical protein HUJ99_01910, partial [Bacteroidaceae bacterium]|nr:hypothetical protein [Bacteroidaceae bacterium]